MKQQIANFRSVGLLLLMMVFLSACVKEEVYHQGPRGHDGTVFFGVDYSISMPYSYADNNPSIPNNPILGDYYVSNGGRYDFEYFVNPYEYWYGTYQLWVDYGLPGGDHGEPGLDGADTYLMLICDPNGFYEERSEVRSVTQPTIVKEGAIGNAKYRIEMKKAHIDVRSPHFPSIPIQ